MKLRSMLAACVFAAACCVPVAAGAQSTTAPATAPDPERLALAHELIDGMNIPKILHATFEKAFAGFSGSIGGLDMQQYGRSMSAGFESMMPGLLDEEAKVYAEVLTTDDLRQAVAFYHSPAGKDLLATIPVVTDRITPLVYAAMPKMFDAVNEDYCKHVTCTDEIRASFNMQQDMMGQMIRKAAK